MHLRMLGGPFHNQFKTVKAKYNTSLGNLTPLDETHPMYLPINNARVLAVDFSPITEELKAQYETHLYKVEAIIGEKDEKFFFLIHSRYNINNALAALVYEHKLDVK